MQPFFLFDYKLDKAVQSGKFYTWGSTFMADVGLSKTAKINVFPLKQNQLIVRVENTFDIFDCTQGTLAKCKSDALMYFDVKKFAQTAWTRANGKNVLYKHINIQETDLAGF